MKKYMVYLDAGDESGDVFKVAVPAENEKDAAKWANGNGDVVAVKEVTDKYPISEYKVSEALLNAGFGRIETDFICRALSRIGLAE